MEKFLAKQMNLKEIAGRYYHRDGYEVDIKKTLELQLLLQQRKLSVVEALKLIK